MSIARDDAAAVRAQLLRGFHDATFVANVRTWVWAVTLAPGIAGLLAAAWALVVAPEPLKLPAFLGVLLLPTLALNALLPYVVNRPALRFDALGLDYIHFKRVAWNEVKEIRRVRTAGVIGADQLLLRLDGPPELALATWRPAFGTPVRGSWLAIDLRLLDIAPALVEQAAFALRDTHALERETPPQPRTGATLAEALATLALGERQLADLLDELNGAYRDASQQPGERWRRAAGRKAAFLEGRLARLTARQQAYADAAERLRHEPD